MSCLRKRHSLLKVDDACGLFGFTRQAYYQGFKRGYESSANIAEILDAVGRIRKKHPKIGTRKIKIILARDYGIDAGRDSLFDIMREAGMLGAQTREAQAHYYFRTWAAHLSQRSERDSPLKA